MVSSVTPTKSDPLAKLRAQLKAGKAVSAKPVPVHDPLASLRAKVKSGNYPSTGSNLAALQNLSIGERLTRLEKLTAK